jgi:hypothetical protein
MYTIYKLNWGQAPKPLFLLKRDMKSQKNDDIVNTELKGRWLQPGRLHSPRSLTRLPLKNPLYVEMTSNKKTKHKIKRVLRTPKIMLLV